MRSLILGTPVFNDRQYAWFKWLMRNAFSCSAETPSQLISLDFQVLGVLRENSVPIDFIRFLGSLTPCFRHEDPARGAGHTVSQSARLHMVQPDGWDPDSRAQTAARRVQAQVEETDDKKLGSVVLVVAFEDLERLEIGTDPGKTGVSAIKCCYAASPCSLTLFKSTVT